MPVTFSKRGCSGALAFNKSGEYCNTGLVTADDGGSTLASAFDQLPVNFGLSAPVGDKVFMSIDGRRGAPIREADLITKATRQISCGTRGRTTFGPAIRTCIGSNGGARTVRTSTTECAPRAAEERVDERSGASADTVLARVERARDDELRHADAMQRWASRLGHDVPEPGRARGGLRAALAVARENAIEGCVRELLGALMVRFQGERSSVHPLREDLTQIADDEAVHASLAIDVASWLEPQLAREERASIEADVARALTELADELTEPSPELRALCGLPTRKESSALLAQVAQALSTLRMMHLC
ncbi:MAG: hypothetical protein RLZZ450_1523 [Pseudomonadota bacterium]